jgi:hypothetical protein
MTAEQAAHVRGYLSGVEFCAKRVRMLCDVIKRNRGRVARDERMCMDGAIGALEDVAKAFDDAVAAGKAEFL